MKKHQWTTIAWTLAGLLFLAALGISFGKADKESKPTVDNYGPSGASALAALLRQNGYSVRNLSSVLPQVHPDEIVIAFVADDEASTEDTAATFEHYNKAAEAGARLLVLPLSKNFGDASTQAATAEVQNTVTKQKLSAELRIDNLSDSLPGQAENAYQLPLWETNQGQAAAYLRTVGKNVELIAADGLIATNRHIDRADNAALLMNLVQTIGGNRKSVAFAEGLFNPSAPNLFDVLGQWAEAAWWQLVFLFVVICFTLGRRFGRPDEQRESQVGQRELVNAIADTYRRARASQLSARAFYDHTDRKLRKALKLSSDIPPYERDAALPEELSFALRQVNDAAIHDLGVQETYSRVAKLKSQTNAFLVKS